MKCAAQVNWDHWFNICRPVNFSGDRSYILVAAYGSRPLLFLFSLTIFFFFTEIILFLYNFHIALCQSWELWILLHWGYGAWERIPPHMEVVTIIAFLRLILRDVNCFRMRQTRTHAEKKKCIETTQWSCLWKCHKFQYR